MISRSVRPIATLTAETEPGPSAQTPLFIPIRSAIGPLTITTGACGPVDIAKVRSPIVSGRGCTRPSRGSPASAAGLAPAITALAAIFSTVPMPMPGAKTPTTSSAGRPDAATIAATFSGVGGTSGRPSLQPASTNRSFMRSKPASGSAASYCEHRIADERDVLERRAHTLGRHRRAQALDEHRHRVVDHLRDAHRILVRERQRHLDDREVGTAEQLGAPPRVLHEPGRDVGRRRHARAPRARPCRASATTCSSRSRRSCRRRRRTPRASGRAGPPRRSGSARPSRPGTS